MSKIKSYAYEELLARYERATSLARLTAKRSMPIAVYNDDLKNFFSHKNAIIINMKVYKSSMG